MSCQRVLPDALDGEPVLTAHHVKFDPLPRLVADARRFVGAHAPDLPEATREALLLATSELVTNAVLHARTVVEVGLTLSEHHVLVTVHDLDLARPQQRPYDGREGGWGLGLVGALTQASGLDVHPGDGKTAWFRVPRGEIEPVGDDVAARPEALSGDGSGGRP